MRLALLLWLCLAGQGPAAYDLVWKPKAGQSFRYDLTLDMAVDGSKTLYQTELAISIPKVEPNGDYTVSSQYRAQKLTVDGKSQAVPDASGDKPQIDRFNARGERLPSGQKEEDDETDPLAKTLGDLTEFTAPAKPVKAGGKWSKVVAGDAKKGISPARIEYTLEKAATDTIHVSFTYAETQAEQPVRASGSLWLDAGDCCLVKLDASIVNLRFEDGGDAIGQARLTVTRRPGP
ncbi:MAG TPA: hypothetical protein VHE55_08245 [Fimbriimonadaceae bacterium]|nr:hypothetical protein [Fimbriimonadaceae bacterium]